MYIGKYVEWREGISIRAVSYVLVYNVFVRSMIQINCVSKTYIGLRLNEARLNSIQMINKHKICKDEKGEGVEV